jgi:uncharacterized membrane protein
MIYIVYYEVKLNTNLYLMEVFVTKKETMNILGVVAEIVLIALIVVGIGVTIYVASGQWERDVIAECHALAEEYTKASGSGQTLLYDSEGRIVGGYTNNEHGMTYIDVSDGDIHADVMHIFDDGSIGYYEWDIVD